MSALHIGANSLERSLLESLIRIQRKHPWEVQLKVYRTLNTILTNVHMDPNNRRHKRIRWSSVRLQSSIISIPEGAELMRCCGFILNESTGEWLFDDATSHRLHRLRDVLYFHVNSAEKACTSGSPQQKRGRSTVRRRCRDPVREELLHLIEQDRLEQRAERRYRSSPAIPCPSKKARSTQPFALFEGIGRPTGFGVNSKSVPGFQPPIVFEGYETLDSLSSSSRGSSCRRQEGTSLSAEIMVDESRVAELSQCPSPDRFLDHHIFHARQKHSQPPEVGEKYKYSDEQTLRPIVARVIDQIISYEVMVPDLLERWIDQSVAARRIHATKNGEVDVTLENDDTASVQFFVPPACNSAVLECKDRIAVLSTAEIGHVVDEVLRKASIELGTATHLLSPFSLAARCASLYWSCYLHWGSDLLRGMT